jgi:hypothetical protein
MKVTLKIRAMALGVLEYDYTNRKEAFKMGLIAEKDYDPKYEEMGYGLDTVKSNDFEVTLYKDIEVPDNLWEMLKEWDVSTTEGYTLTTPLFEIGVAGGMVFDVTPEKDSKELRLMQAVETSRRMSKETFEEWAWRMDWIDRIFGSRITQLEKYAKWAQVWIDEIRERTEALTKYRNEQKEKVKTAEELLATGWRTTEVDV